MAEKVRITGIEGSYACTMDGRRLRIIGNVNPKRYAYTDGVVVYGNAQPGFYRPPVVRKKTFPLVLDLLGYGMEYFYEYPDHVDLGLNERYDPRCPSCLWWNKKFYTRSNTVNYSGWQQFTVTDEAGHTALTLQNGFVIDFGHENGRDVFTLQLGDYTTRPDKNGYIEYYTSAGSSTTDYFSNWPSDMQLPLRGSLNDLRMSKDGTNYSVANVLDTFFDDLKASVQASAGPSIHFLGWGLFKNDDYNFSQDDTVNCANLIDYDKDYGAKRFLKISDTELIIFADVMAVTYPLNSTYAPAGSPGWWPLLYWFRRCIKVDLATGTYGVLYARNEARWYAEYTAWANMPLYLQNETAVTPYVKDLGEGYKWNSGDKLIYNGNTAIGNEQYEDVKGVYGGNIIGRKVSDGHYYFNATELYATGVPPLSDFYPDYVNMFRVMPLKK